MLTGRLPKLALIVAGGWLAGVASSLQAQQQVPVQPPAGPRPILRETFIGEMDAQFRKIDADKDGRLTRVEIEQFQKLAAVADAEARNKALFAQLDTNRNGSLSPAEFAKLVTAPATADAAPMISRMDGNRDQQISLIEHRAATLANFDRIDADKDGIVTPAEMKAAGITPR